MPNPDPIIDILRARIPISELIEESVELTTAGDLLRGRCSAHRDDAKGLYVNRTQGSFHCFSCGRHGDVVRWTRETVRCSEEDAIALLCERAGLAPHLPGSPTGAG